MAVKYILVLLFLVSNVFANSEEVLSGTNESSSVEVLNEANITQIIEAIVPDVILPEENSTLINKVPLPEDNSTLINEEDSVVFSAAVNDTINNFVSKMKSQALIGKTQCDTNEICQSIPSSGCKDGLCECLETHVPSLNSTECYKIATETENQCEIDMQCKEIADSKCVNQKCIKEETILKTASSVSQSELTKDNGSVSGTRIYLSLLVFNCLFLIYN